MIKCDITNNFPWSNLEVKTEAIEAPTKPAEMKIFNLSWSEIAYSYL